MVDSDKFKDILLKNDNENTPDAKLVPFNYEAEQAVLGAIINNNEYINQIGDILKAEHFYSNFHKKIFETISKFYERGLISTPITLKNYFDVENEAKEINFTPLEYLVHLSRNATTIVNLVHYAKDIYEKAMMRSLITIGQTAVTEAQNITPDLGVDRLIERTEQRLFNLATEGNSENNMMTLKGSIAESIRRIDSVRRSGAAISGVTTGFVEMDRVLGGMHPSDLLILAARPSMGKTALALNMAKNAAEYFAKSGKEKKSVAIFSLEMSSEQIANRLISVATGINGAKIRTGQLSKEDFDVLLSNTVALSELPILIDDTPAITIQALRTRARRLKRQHNVGLIVVDYLQLMRGSGIGEANRVKEIGEISQGLKAIAKELDVPVLALSQLSRAVELREDKRPQLSDLRESGNIEQDADVVMFIYRDEYYLGRKMPTNSDQEEFLKWEAQMESVRNVADVLVAKQRNGPVDNIRLYFDSATNEFGNLSANRIAGEKIKLISNG